MHLGIISAPKVSTGTMHIVSSPPPPYIIFIQGEEKIVCVDTLGALIMPRCINWASQHGQKTRNNFLTDHFSFLLLPCRVRCPKVAKNGLLERWRALFSIAIGHLGAPSSQRRQRPSKAARTPIEHDERSSSMWRSANPSKGAKASITRSVIPPSVSRAVQ